MVPSGSFEDVFRIWNDKGFPLPCLFTGGDNFLKGPLITAPIDTIFGRLKRYVQTCFCFQVFFNFLFEFDCGCCKCGRSHRKKLLAVLASKANGFVQCINFPLH